MNASVKTLKCSKCPVRCDNVVERIDDAVSRCRHRSPRDPAGCGLYQLSQVIARVSNTPLPRLLEKKPDLPEIEHCATQEECSVNYPRCKTCQSFPEREVKREERSDDFEVNIPDPIVVFVHKNGYVENRS